MKLLKALVEIKFPYLIPLTYKLSFLSETKQAVPRLRGKVPLSNRTPKISAVHALFGLILLPFLPIVRDQLWLGYVN